MSRCVWDSDLAHFVHDAWLHVDVATDVRYARCTSWTIARISHQLLVKVLVARAAEPLVAVRAVTSKYRMTNTPAPTTPSLYVRGVTQPLRAATSEAAAASSRNGSAGCLTHVSAEVRAEVLGQVISGIARKYTELVVEVFANVKRLGQTLKKLQKGAASAGDGGMSDDEKIYLQVTPPARARLVRAM